MNDIGNELKEWQTWLSSAAGQYLIDWEQKQLDALVGDLFGFHALQLGFPQVTLIN